jgi:hypothetical protein
MRQIGNFPFPDQENAEDTDNWLPAIHVRALNRDVLCVATTQIEGRWRAYIGAVAGLNHDEEWSDILRHGGRLPESVASAVFPEFKGVPYAC